MENNFGPIRSMDPEGAAALLDDVQGDRTRLTQRVRTPKWVGPGFGFIAALYVATPAVPGNWAGSFVLAMALVAVIVMVHLSHRATGVRFSRLGLQAWAAFAAATLGTLALFSVALGFAATNLHWLIIAPACAAFGLSSWLAKVFFSSMRQGLARVR